MLKIITTGLVDQVLFRKKIFNKNLVAIHEIKPVLTLDKSIYVGFIIPTQPNFWCMGFITNKLKESLVLIYYLNTQTF